MSLSPEDINVLIVRHLQESNFTHTAYIFENEADIDYSNYSFHPQALISILQKGMLYMQLEKGLNERARNDHSPSSVISSVFAAVIGQDPLPKPHQKSKSASISTNSSIINVAKERALLTIENQDIISYNLHDNEVSCGMWTSDGRLFATGSADATAIIWSVSESGFCNHAVLDHATQHNRTNKEVVSVCWNHNGTLLATGCSDGIARLWLADGTLKFVLAAHSQPVYTVSFSPDGQYLLTGSGDSSVISWNVHTGQKQQIFNFHSQKTLDIDWFDNSTFAFCTEDSKIIICVLGIPRPIFELSGHTGAVNEIAWDPSKKYLASCSDDKTIRIWFPFEKDQWFSLEGHTLEVYTIEWVPQRKNSYILASGGFDSSVRVWDVQKRTCLYIINDHSDCIYSITFSPNGINFLTGGKDNVVNVYRTNSGTKVAKCNTNGSVFGVYWNPKGNLVSICQNDSSVSFLKTSQLQTVLEQL